MQDYNVRISTEQEAIISTKERVLDKKNEREKQK